MPKVLLVDDSLVVLKTMEKVLEESGFRYASASSGEEALKKIFDFKPDLVFLDLIMPGMDGIEVCRKLKADQRTAHIPVVMITVETDREAKLKALECGVSDFIAKPPDPVELMVRTQNLLKIKEYEDFLSLQNERLENEVRKRTFELKNALKKLQEANLGLEASRKEIKDGYIDTIQRLTRIAEYKDKGTAQHIKRVSRYCSSLAKEMGWSGAEVEAIHYASPMHDIGKVGIPSDILLKPGTLSREEFALVKTHTLIGAETLSGSKSNILQMAERIALTHHERWDGTGYPNALKGDAIALEGAIMNIADQYDALRSDRPYKPALSHQEVLEIITRGDGRTMPSHFHPDILRVFRSMHEEFATIFGGHSHA